MNAVAQSGWGAPIASRSSWPIIVGGCHRSGTSLVRRLLNAHSRIHCGPEVKFFRDFYDDYAVKDPIRRARFLASARALIPEAEVLDVLGAAFVTLHERAAARAGKPRWADKAPENVLYAAEWGRLLGDRWLFVHVVRNPLDTLASIKESWFLDDSVPKAFDERIAFYRRYIRAGLEVGSIQPERYLRVIYDELVRRPEATLQTLMAWLGEDHERAQLVFNDSQHQAGLEDPKVKTTTAIHKDSVGRWRQLLTMEEAQKIAAECADLWREIDHSGQYWTFSVPP